MAYSERNGAELWISLAITLLQDCWSETLLACLHVDPAEHAFCPCLFSPSQLFVPDILSALIPAFCWERTSSETETHPRAGFFSSVAKRTWRLDWRRQEPHPSWPAAAGAKYGKIMVCAADRGIRKDHCLGLGAGIRSAWFAPLPNLPDKGVEENLIMIKDTTNKVRKKKQRRKPHASYDKAHYEQSKKRKKRERHNTKDRGSFFYFWNRYLIYSRDLLVYILWPMTRIW